MPTKIAFQYNGDSITTQCGIHGIAPNPNNTIEAWVADGVYLELLNFKSGVGTPVRKLVLFHPSLPTKIIRGPLTLLKTKEVSCGFKVIDALHFDLVFVVGPFTQADLTPLVATHVTLDTAAPFNSATALRQYLETRL